MRRGKDRVGLTQTYFNSSALTAAIVRASADAITGSSGQGRKPREETAEAWSTFSSGELACG
jgi:hypothetical protein